MTKDEALKLALEALEKDPAPLNAINNAKCFLYSALEQPERKWVGLTDEEIEKLGDKHLVNIQEYIGFGEYFSFVDGETDFARAIEAKLKEKNR